jgi:hypothetical protein
MDRWGSRVRRSIGSHLFDHQLVVEDSDYASHPLIGASQPGIAPFVLRDGGAGTPFTPLIDTDGLVGAENGAPCLPGSSQRKNKPSELKYSSSRIDARNELDGLRNFIYALQGIVPKRKENLSADLYMFALRYLR